MGEKKPKTVWEKTYPCPHCGKSIHTLIEKYVTNEPVSAKYDFDETIEKAQQTTLEESQ
jgi:deoxycytidylate deaminase